MFIELMPRIERRAITITVTALNQGHIRVNVVPASSADDSKINEKIGYSNKDKIAPIPESAIHALTTPLSLTGTPDEIDAQLADQLKTFVESHLALQQSVARAKQEIADAVKAVEERDKNRSKLSRPLWQRPLARVQMEATWQHHSQPAASRSSTPKPAPETIPA